MKKKKYLIALTLTVISMSLSACGNETDSSANNQVTNNTSKVEETIELESTEKILEPEIEVETETEPEVEVESTEEIVEETVLDESEVEMVDFETWAKQEGNDGLCVVVWNEGLGIQEVIQPYQEKQEIRVINEGDRFAIPYNEKIRAVMIDDEDILPPLVDYREVSVMKGQQIVIIFENEEGDLQTINFLF